MFTQVEKKSNIEFSVVVSIKQLSKNFVFLRLPFMQHKIYFMWGKSDWLSLRDIYLEDDK